MRHSPATPRQTAELKARQALALLLAGDDEAGLPLYQQCLSSGAASALPLGAHLEFLDRAGKGETADALRTLALDLGGNLARKGSAINGAPIDPVAEYESLFARGLINSRMVQEYLILLSRLGHTDRVRAILDPDRLLRIVRIDPAFGAATRDLLLREESNAGYSEAAQSIRKMRRIDDFETLAPALVASMRAEAERYLADWAASDHPLAALVPANIRLKTWGLISRGEGFNTRHFHHRGWATGVYYPAGLEPGPGGELCVGRPIRLRKDVPGWPELDLRPEPGTLVLMPSFYTHWTVPLGRPGLRLSVAFDMIRAQV